MAIKIDAGNNKQKQNIMKKIMRVVVFIFSVSLLLTSCYDGPFALKDFEHVVAEFSNGNMLVDGNYSNGAGYTRVLRIMNGDKVIERWDNAGNPIVTPSGIIIINELVISSEGYVYLPKECWFNTNINRLVYNDTLIAYRRVFVRHLSDEIFRMIKIAEKNPNQNYWLRMNEYINYHECHDDADVLEYLPIFEKNYNEVCLIMKEMEENYTRPL